MRIKNFIEKLYYKLYKYNIQNWGADENPRLMALLAIALFIFAHIVMVVAYVFIGFKMFPQELNLNFKILSVVIFFLLLLLLYIKVGKERRHTQIVEKYEHLSEKGEFKFVVLKYLGIMLLLNFLLISFLKR